MWYAVWVKTGQEEKVLALCNRMIQNVEKDSKAYEQCYFPKYERARKLNGRWVIRKEALFSGYLFFVSENVEMLSRQLKSIPEFTKVLGDEQSPIALHPHEVDFLQKFTNENKVLEMSMGFLEGDKLVVTDGPLRNYQGKIVHIDRHKRLALLEMVFFGRTVRMKVGLEVVSKI